MIRRDSKKAGRPPKGRVHRGLEVQNAHMPHHLAVFGLLAWVALYCGALPFPSGAAGSTDDGAAGDPAGNPAGQTEGDAEPVFSPPFTEGVADSSSWVDVHEVPEEPSGDWAETLTLRMEAETDTLIPSPVRMIPPGSRGVPAIPDIPLRMNRTGVGLYLGYASTLGLMVSAPVDGPLGLRFGLTAFPGLGVAWTPGFEVRLSQEPETYSREGYHLFGNLLLARTYGDVHEEHVGLEAGLGYRWVVSDRQGYRWIAGAEAGGFWDEDSGWPDRPCVRIYWLLADW